MESLESLLERYQRHEPDEIAAIKHYLAAEFPGTPASVGLQGDQAVVITVASASLANALRLRTPAIRAAANTTKRLIFRIG